MSDTDRLIEAIENLTLVLEGIEGMVTMISCNLQAIVEQAGREKGLQHE